MAIHLSVTVSQQFEVITTLASDYWHNTYFGLLDSFTCVMVQ